MRGEANTATPFPLGSDMVGVCISNYPPQLLCVWGLVPSVLKLAHMPAAPALRLPALPCALCAPLRQARLRPAPTMKTNLSGPVVAFLPLRSLRSFAANQALRASHVEVSWRQSSRQNSGASRIGRRSPWTGEVGLLSAKKAIPTPINTPNILARVSRRKRKTVSR